MSVFLSLGLCLYLSIVHVNLSVCAILAASLSSRVVDSPEALPANSFLVKVLPYLMIHERVKQQ